MFNLQFSKVFLLLLFFFTYQQIKIQIYEYKCTHMNKMFTRTYENKNEEIQIKCTHVYISK